MREWELLEHIRQSSAGQPVAFPQVVIPPGDDCAVVRVGRESLLLKVDQVIEGRHVPAVASWRGGPFAAGLSRGAFLDLVARKAVARVLSDIAAMAGTPVAGLASAAVPPAFPGDAARELAEALHRWGARWHCPIVGGDVATFAATHPGPLSLSVSVLGTPHPARGAVLRSGARPGDAVYVTGMLGVSLAPDGLGRHVTFEPRLAEARWLADMLGANLHAMLDVSDGLGIDAARLAATSGVRLELDERHIPLAPGATIANALRDGEDYELLFAASGAVPSVCPATGCPVTRLGNVRDGPPGVVLRAADGSTRDVSREGWEHA
ncbi:MAG: thiamine-monophosphate kinase [Phycisphaerae bacterium]|nr:MAG: thiamine-monophosphate kinase [Phycisphaerae bacterium]